MTELVERPSPEGGTAVVHEHDAQPRRARARPTGLLKWLTSTDHKVIGKSYMITSLVLLFIAGILALIRTSCRAERSFVSFPSTTSCSPCTAA